MKITCIVGSARANGSTDYLVNTFIKGVKDADSSADIKKYSMSDAKIYYCYGCKNAMRTAVVCRTMTYCPLLSIFLILTMLKKKRCTL